MSVLVSWYTEYNGIDTLLILFDFCKKEETRLHGPIDSINIIIKALKARQVIYKDGVAFLCGRSTPIFKLPNVSNKDASSIRKRLLCKAINKRNK